MRCECCFPTVRLKLLRALVPRRPLRHALLAALPVLRHARMVCPEGLPAQLIYRTSTARWVKEGGVVVGEESGWHSAPSRERTPRHSQLGAALDHLELRRCALLELVRLVPLRTELHSEWGWRAGWVMLAGDEEGCTCSNACTRVHLRMRSGGARARTRLKDPSHSAHHPHPYPPRAAALRTSFM